MPGCTVQSLFVDLMNWNLHGFIRISFLGLNQAFVALQETKAQGRTPGNVARIRSKASKLTVGTAVEFRNGFSIRIVSL